MSGIIFDRIPQQHFDIKLHDITFVICENPTNDNIPEFIQLFEAMNVKHLIRIAIKNYDVDQFVQRGIKVLEMQFEHQQLPSEQTVKLFMQIVNTAKQLKQNIAIQGVSGKTRAPLLAACAMCEDGVSVDQVIQRIRESISGQVFNPDQVEFLYQRYTKRK